MSLNKFTLIHGLLPQIVVVSLSPCKRVYQDTLMCNESVSYELDLLSLKDGNTVFMYLSPLSESYRLWLYNRRMALAELKERQ